MARLDLTKSRDEVTLDGAQVTWVKNTEWRDATKKSRVFVWADDESILDNLVNRTRRPYEAWRVLALKVMAQLESPYAGMGVATLADNIKLRWSQHAGCSCPCSPGFIVEEGALHGLRGGDLHIHIAGIATVDESKPAQELM